MIIHLSGDVDYEMFNSLVKSFNGLTKEEILHIYFTSPQGGMVDVAEVLINFINSNKEHIQITFYGELFSAGMLIFLYINCRKNILKDTRGMFHFSYQSMDISEGGKPSSDYDIFSMKEMRKSKAKTIEFLQTTQLTSKELCLIKKGRDVYFSYDRMIELLNN